MAVVQLFKDPAEEAAEILDMIKYFKPPLNTFIKPEDFRAFYWEKTELIHFCQQQKLPYNGMGKIELIDMIERFLRTGESPALPTPINKVERRDSDQPLSKNTPVINYKNDRKTKDFFVQHIGKHFRFNAYLRAFAKTPNLDGSLTYGDLIRGWLQAEEEKTLSADKSLGSQFEYNQFQKDFYAAERLKKRPNDAPFTGAEMVNAWKIVRAIPGPATYAHYVEFMRAARKCLRAHNKDKV